MKNFFNIKERKKESVCPVCGGALVDEFCANCNKYTSDETAHKRLKEKHPHVRCKCKSKKIEFSIEESKDPIPKNFLDKAALSLIEKYNQKYPQNIPTYREVAKCKKCGNKWYVDGYRDDNKIMVSIRNGFLIVSVIILFALIITVGSISENIKDSSKTSKIEPTSQTTQIATEEETTTELIEDSATTEVSTTEDITTTDDEPIITTTDEITTTETTTREATTKETTTKETTTKSGIIVYITPYGKKYHYSASCAGGNAMERDYDDVKNAYDPCKKCAY